MNYVDNSLRLHEATGIQWKLAVYTAVFAASGANELLCTFIAFVLCVFLCI